MIDIHSRKTILTVPLILVIAAALVVWLAPEEQALGTGIKSVYVHVSLIWVGMLGLTLAGVLGSGVALSASPRLQRWMHSIGWVGLAFFVAGMGMSFLAAGINWGAVFWEEPRNRAMTNVMAITLIVQVLSNWIPWIRGRGLLHVIPAALLTWSVLSTPLVLHPRSPILTSSSTAIQITFVGLFGLGCLGAGWITWHLQRSQNLPVAVD